MAISTPHAASPAAPDHMPADATDRRFCREALPQVSRTFALNIRLLTGTLGEAVRTGYLLCRAADGLEDSWPGEPGSIRRRFDAFRLALGGDARALASLSAEARALASDRRDLALVAELARVLRVHASLPPAHRAALTEGAGTLAEGMGRYAARAAERPTGAPYLDTEAELEDYCWVVAGCVGVMLTRLFAAEYGATDPAHEARRLALAPAVGQALQLTNILLDWPSDVRNGRCYLPASWLAETGTTPRDLVDRGGPGTVALARRLERKARAALARVPEYLDLIPVHRVRYRLFCLWPALWALGSLRHARRDPEFPWGPRRPKLPRSEVLGAAFGSALAAHHPATLRGLYALTAGPAATT
ncbi:MAG: phytoene/squalene synthase family protein [Candidatus Eiseniibacteriota bacterium]